MKQAIIGIICVFALGLVFISTEQKPVIMDKTNTDQSKQKQPKRYDQPDKAAQWLMELRQTPDNKKTPSQLNNQFKTAIEALELAKKTNPDAQAGVNTWVPKLKFENLGPSNFGGRIRGFVIKTGDSNQLLAGGVSGGVFKSDNQGQSWRGLSDFLPTLAIGSMIADPDNANRVFIGTGEGFFNFDAARGAGIFVSEDFGENWVQLSSTDNADFYYVNRMARIPNSNRLLAATRTGIFVSDNLGQSWLEMSEFQTLGRGFVDLKRDPSDSNHLLAYHYGPSNDVVQLTIVTPAAIAGAITAIPAGFGPDFSSNGTGNRDLVLVDDTVGASNDACEAIAANLTGKIALAQRGSCNFTLKVKNAQNAGAIAVVIYQNTNDPVFTMGGEDNTINIPSAMISKAEGELLAAQTENITANLKIATNDVLTQFIMQSHDAGSNWSVLDAANGLPEINIGRMEIGFGTDGVSYIAVSNANDQTRGLWRANAGSNQYSKTSSNTAFVERQGWYDLAIGVKPDDSNTVFVGAVDQFVTKNAGITINKNTFWIPSSTGDFFNMSRYIHSDHHGYFFDPNNPNIQYVVGDGGISISTDNGTSYSLLNNGLSISQSYGIAVSPDGKKINSGTQDNGSQLFFGDNHAWLEWASGDGGFSGWDQQQGNFIYGSRPNGAMIGSNNAGLNFTDLNLPDTVGARFIQPFALNPNNGNQMLVGTDNVFYTANARLLNQATFQDISGTLDGSNVNAVAFNPSVANQVFAGTLSGGVYKVNGAGTQNTLSNITPTASDGLGSLEGAITDIKPLNNNTIYVTRGSYFPDRVIVSHDGGGSWQSISANLPDMPVFQISIDPKNSDILYVGTELGLWVTDISAANQQWLRYDYGLAYTRVIDLVWHQQDTLYVGTHGRGTYRASRQAIDISLNKFVTTDSNNDDDGILDNGEVGLYMLNLTNTTGFDIYSATLDILPTGINNNQDINLPVANIAAHSSVVVPIDASLNANTLCQSQVNLAIELSYDNGISQNSTISVISAANSTLSSQDYSQDAENANHDMSTQLLLGNSQWQRVTTNANSGARSWFTSDESSYADKSLISPWLTMDAGGNKLNFALKYNTEGDALQRYDGVLLELREQGGLWIDIGHLSSVAYDGQLFTNNSAQGRKAWSGAQPNWRQASVNLGEQYKGKTIQFRFRMVSDSNTGGQGFWVDDISMSHVIVPSSPDCDDNISTGGVIPFSGLWFDRSKNGHGFAIEPVGQNNLYFVIFYTYDDAGNSEWYSSVTTLENGVLNLNFDAGTLEKFIYDFSINPSVSQAAILDPALTDGRLSINFNSNTVAGMAACQDGTQGRDNSSVALAKWKINAQQGEWCIEPIINESIKRFPDMSGTWFAGLADTGWGFSIAQAQNLFTSINYYYDAQGLPRWSIGTAAGFAQNQDFTLPLTEVNGYGRTQTPIALTTVDAGSVTFHLINALNNINIDGTATVNFQHQGVAGGEWIRNAVPITIFTQVH